MKFWRKKDDDIILDCYTYNPYAYNFAKINYGYHYIPEWWKKTPKNKGSGNDTIKNCPAIVEYYKKSMHLIKSKGVIVLDNMLWGGEVLNPKDKESQTIADTAKMINNDSMYNTMLTIRDGLMLCIKR